MLGVGDTSCSGGAWGWVTPRGVSREEGGLGVAGLTGGSVEQFRMSVPAEAACGAWLVAQPGGAGTPRSLRLQPGVPPAPCSSPEPAPGQLSPSSPVPSTEPAQLWGFLRKTAFLAPGIVGENQHHHPAQEEANAPGHGQRPGSPVGSSRGAAGARRAQELGRGLAGASPEHPWR